MSSFMEDLVNM